MAGKDDSAADVGGRAARLTLVGAEKLAELANIVTRAYRGSIWQILAIRLFRVGCGLPGRCLGGVRLSDMCSETRALSAEQPNVLADHRSWLPAFYSVQSVANPSEVAPRLAE